MFTGLKTFIFLNGYKLVHVNRDLNLSMFTGIYKLYYVYKDINFFRFTGILTFRSTGI